MSSAERAAGLLMSLTPEELRIIQALELGMQKYSFVPVEDVGKYSGFGRSEVDHWIKSLDRKGLLYRQPEPYLGYILNYTGYDCLALNALAKMDLLNSLGRPLGVGKEADIFEALTDDDRQVAVKFHRLGRTSFRETRKKRGYVASRGHLTWYYQSRLAAEKEYQFMKLAYDAGVSVPEPIMQNRHLVVMGFIDGYNLIDVKEIDDPEGLLDDILENAKMTYSAGVIHGDLSGFNIIVTKDGIPLLIDWPQAVPTDHPNSESLIKRDVDNVLDYFKRKYFVEKDPEAALLYVKSGTPAVEERQKN